MAIRLFDERGQTSSTGNLILVAIALVGIGTLGYTAFQIAGKLSGGPPTTELQTSYNDTSQNVTIEMINGDNIDTENLKVVGGAINKTAWSTETIEAGDTITYPAYPGDTVRVIWETEDQSYVLKKTTVPVPTGWYVASKWNRESDGDSLSMFKNLYEPVDTQGLEWREKSTYIGVAQKKDNTASWAKHVRELPKNNGSIRLDLHFEADSFEDSGIKIYAVDANGNKHLIKCDESDNSGFAPTGERNINCPSGNKGKNFRWDGTFRVDAGSELQKLVIVIDMENTPSFNDEGRFYRLSAELYSSS